MSHRSSDPSRRAFARRTLALLAAGLAGAPGAGRAAVGRGVLSAPRLFDWRRLTPRAWLAVGNGGNSVVLADGAEVLLVDTKELGYGAALRREAAAVVGRPVTRVVTTHHHADHALGNAAFTADVPVAAHRAARARTVARAARALAEAADAADAGRDPFAAHEADLREWTPYFGQVRVEPEVRAAYGALVDAARAARRGGATAPAALDALAERFAPTELFDTAREVRVGRLAVELHHAGPGHTDNDAFLVVPEEHLVVAGDLVCVGVHPYVDVGAGADTRAWQRSLDALDAACARVERAGRGGPGGRAAVVAPGHGPATDRAGVRAQRAYFDRLRAAVEPAVRAGRPRQEVTALVVPGLPAERADVGAANLGVVYDELRAGSR